MDELWDLVREVKSAKLEEAYLATVDMGDALLQILASLLERDIQIFLPLIDHLVEALVRMREHVRDLLLDLLGERLHGVVAGLVRLRRRRDLYLVLEILDPFVNRF